jgi:hypothetical protein
MIDLHNRKFVSLYTLGGKGTMNYSFKQYGDIVQGCISEGGEHFGQLIGLVDKLGVLHFTFSLKDHALIYRAGTGSITVRKFGLIGKCCWSVGKQDFEDYFILHEVSSLVNIQVYK